MRDCSIGAAKNRDAKKGGSGFERLMAVRFRNRGFLSGIKSNRLSGELNEWISADITRLHVKSTYLITITYHTYRLNVHLLNKAIVAHL
jgi:hypothetical protein